MNAWEEQAKVKVGAEIGALEAVAALPVGIQKAQHGKQAGLARARGAHDAQKITLLDAQADLAQHEVARRGQRVGLFDFVQLDHGEAVSFH